jgi:hypothetical protein
MIIIKKGFSALVYLLLKVYTHLLWGVRGTTHTHTHTHRQTHSL